MPIIEDYFATHQWARELIRFGLRNPTGIYFKIPDDTEIWFGDTIKSIIGGLRQTQ